MGCPGCASSVEGRHPSGAKAHMEWVAFSARLKSCPFEVRALRRPVELKAGGEVEELRLVGCFAGLASGGEFVALVPLDGVGGVEDLPA